MALTLGDNFSYLGAKPLDGRVKYDTIADMVAMSASTLYDGIIAFCVADGKNYQWKSTNTVDETLGKWRELATGGGGETYSDFTGATESAAGAHGLVPAPSAGDEGKVLFGNGLWGALPSVDLSMLSNEAFIFSETEKPVGMAPNRKLLYAKTIDCGAGPNDTTKVVATGISNFESGWLLFGVMQSTNLSDIWCKPLPSANPETVNDNIYIDYNNGNIRLDSKVNYSNNSQCYVTFLYTKTTDSPLPSDVKFAGVTSAGEVILEKTFTGINVESVSGQWINVVDVSTLSVDKLIDVVFRQTSEKCIAAGGARVNGSNLQIFSYVAFGINEVTIKYTIAS